jgi:hypothetical protein
MERPRNRMEQYTASSPRAGGGEERSQATAPFDFAQDRESVERPVVGQMIFCW